MKLYKSFLTILSTLLIINCSVNNDQQLMKKAEELSQKFIITDGHIDLPWRLYKGGYEDVSVRTPGGDFDYVRAKQGGLDAPFMSIYVPATYQVTGGAKDKALELMGFVERVSTEHPNKFEIAYNISDVERIFSEGKIALPMGMENGAPLEGDLSNIEFFHKKGISYITLTHSEDNDICDSSYNLGERTHNGLSEFGVKVIKEMNRVGIMVDISHVSDEAFYQAMDVTEVPAIASHSSARHFTPGFERNMSDDMIKRLAENGGVIQINFGTAFLTNINDKSKGYNPDTYIHAEVSDVVDHIDRVVELVGIDYVGIGSDYDGVGDTLPNQLKDVSSYPNLIAELQNRGYSTRDIQKILGENFARVWREVEEYARNN